MIKRGVKYLLSMVGYELRRKANELPVSNIIHSKIQKKEMIDIQAVVQYSELRGSVTVGAFSLLNKVLLDGDISIGRNTTINGPSTEFYAINHPIVIGNYCSIARGTSIQEHNHDVNKITTYFIRHRVFKEPYGIDAVSKGRIEIGHDVWIGTQCVILTGVKIGNGAVVAANSVVTEDVPDYAIVGGSPARILKYRFPDSVIKILSELQWWNWSHERILKNHKLFHEPLTEELLKALVTE